MRQIAARRPSPAIVLGIVALVAALAGTAVAGPEALTSAPNKKKVKQIARQQANKRIKALAPGLADEQIDKRAPGLSVASAARAGTAANASRAGTAANANALGGNPPSAFVAGTGKVTVRTVDLLAGQEQLVADLDGFGELYGRCPATPANPHGFRYAQTAPHVTTVFLAAATPLGIENDPVNASVEHVADDEELTIEARQLQLGLLTEDLSPPGVSVQAYWNQRASGGCRFLTHIAETG